MASRVKWDNNFKLGTGFNSYTGQPCLHGAVTVQNTEKNVASSPHEAATYTHKYTSKISDVYDNLNISGSLGIKYGPISGSGSGKYLDSSVFKSSDINLLVSCHISFQSIESSPGTEVFNDLKVNNFNQVYGDSYISGYEEGGYFMGVVSISLDDKNKKTDIEAKLNVDFKGAAATVTAQGEVQKASRDLETSARTTFFIDWTGPDITTLRKDASKAWTIEELYLIGAQFPSACAKSTYRTNALLTQYIHCKSFQEQEISVSPLDYANATLQTKVLLDDYLDYQAVLDDLKEITTALGNESLTITPRGTEKENGAFAETVQGFADARLDALKQMGAITQLVDKFAVDPKTAATWTENVPYEQVISWKSKLPKTTENEDFKNKVDPNIIVKSRPSVTLLPNGTHSIFAIATDGNLWHKNATPGQAIEKPGIWEALSKGTWLNADYGPTSVGIGAAKEYTEHVFVVGANSKLYTTTIPSSSTAGHVKAFPPGKDISFQGSIASLARSDVQRIDFCAIGVDGYAYWTFYTGGQWSIMAAIGNTMLVGQPTLRVNEATKALYIFGVNHDLHMVLSILQNDSSGWTAWKTFTDTCVVSRTLSTTIPVATTDQIDVFHVGIDHGQSAVCEAVINADVFTWAPSIAKAHPQSPVEASSVGDWHEELFIIGDGGSLWQSTWSQPKKQEFEKTWRKIAEGPFRRTQPVAVRFQNQPTKLVLYVVDSNGKLVRLISDDSVEAWTLDKV